MYHSLHPDFSQTNELKNLGQGDRTIYLGSPLCIQVVTPKLHDQELCEAMGIIDSTLKRHYDLNKANKSML